MYIDRLWIARGKSVVHQRRSKLVLPSTSGKRKQLPNVVADVRWRRLGSSSHDLRDRCRFDVLFLVEKLFVKLFAWSQTNDVHRLRIRIAAR